MKSEEDGINFPRRIFAKISDEEKTLFEFLLAVITEEKIKKIRMDKWECLEKEQIDVILLLLNEVSSDSVDWQLGEEEIRCIEFKLRYPLLYRLKRVQYAIETDEELASKDDIKMSMQCICENIDSLYEKTCKKVDASSANEKTVKAFHNEVYSIEDEELEEWLKELVNNSIRTKDSNTI